MRIDFTFKRDKNLEFFENAMFCYIKKNPYFDETNPEIMNYFGKSRDKINRAIQSLISKGYLDKLDHLDARRRVLRARNK